MTDRHRVVAVIKSVRGPHTEDHGILTTWVHLEGFGGGWGQGFGGLCLDPGLADDYVRDLCNAFGVRAMDELVGKECRALYSFGEHNEPIEGLESVETGRRFVHNAWRRKHFPETTSIIDQKVESIRATIAQAERRAVEERKRLASIEEKYVDWELPNASRVRR